MKGRGGWWRHKRRIGATSAASAEDDDDLEKDSNHGRSPPGEIKLTPQNGTRSGKGDARKAQKVQRKQHGR